MTTGMSKADYLTRIQEDDSWAPGWEAIDGAFEVLYPGVKPPHFATNMAARYIFGGDQYIDGFSIFPSPRGFQHVLTYGMSSLYSDAESFGGQESGWGYEMTLKVAAEGTDDALWAVDSLSHLARYTWTTKNWFEPYQFIGGGGQPLRQGSGSLLTSYLVVPDTEVPGIDTVHGRVDFLQLVGITDAEYAWLAASVEPGSPDDPGTRCRTLADRLIESGNPLLITDLTRTTSHV